MGFEPMSSACIPHQKDKLHMNKSLTVMQWGYTETLNKAHPSEFMESLMCIATLVFFSDLSLSVSLFSFPT